MISHDKALNFNPLLGSLNKIDTAALNTLHHVLESPEMFKKQDIYDMLKFLWYSINKLNLPLPYKPSVRLDIVEARLEDSPQRGGVLKFSLLSQVEHPGLGKLGIKVNGCTISKPDLEQDAYQLRGPLKRVNGMWVNQCGVTKDLERYLVSMVLRQDIGKMIGQLGVGGRIEELLEKEEEV